MSWWYNSLKSFRNRSDNNNKFALVVIAFGSLILLQSFRLHRNKRKTVRVLTDICALCSIITGIGVLTSNILYTQESIAIGADLFGYGICSSTIAVCDSLVTFSRYKLLVRDQNFYWMNIGVGFYLFIFVVSSNLLFYTIIPIFIDVNNGKGLLALNICLYYVYCPSFCIFNLVFSAVFIKKIMCFRHSRTERHPKLLKLAYRSCASTFISIGVNCLMAYSSMHNPIQGQLLYCMITTGMLHFLFNCPWSNKSLEDRYHKISEMKRIEPIDIKMDSLEARLGSKVSATPKPADLPSFVHKQMMAGNAMETDLELAGKSLASVSFSNGIPSFDVNGVGSLPALYDNFVGVGIADCRDDDGPFTIRSVDSDHMVEAIAEEEGFL